MLAKNDKVVPAPSEGRRSAETRRKKLVDETNVRSKELRAEKERTVNEEDTERTELIRKRFETDTEELKEERLQERRGLLSRLGEREAVGNGRNEIELHFTHIRFLYDM